MTTCIFIIPADLRDEGNAMVQAWMASPGLVAAAEI